MFRVWAKLFKENRMLKDYLVIDDSFKNRTNKVFQALEDTCYEFDLCKPIWLQNNISEFKRHGKTKFKSDSFIEEIDFDYLEFQVIEED